MPFKFISATRSYGISPPAMARNVRRLSLRLPEMLAALAMLVMLSLAAAASDNAQAQTSASPIPVVAAENFYGDLVNQLGGPWVRVTSILQNPGQDPHLFEVSVSTAKLLNDAQLVLYNGLDYDPWMEKMLRSGARHSRKVLIAAVLTGRQPSDNPHLWYDVLAMQSVARAISRELQSIDPAHSADYSQRLNDLLGDMKPLTTKITDLKRRYAGLPVTATEPVFGPMASALGMDMRHAAFQLAVMNNTEPSASDVIALEKDLRTRAVRVLFYNRQTASRPARKAQRLAETAGVAVVGISETLPAGKNYQQWMLDQLELLERSLQGATP